MGGGIGEWSGGGGCGGVGGSGRGRRRGWGRRRWVGCGGGGGRGGGRSGWSQWRRGRDRRLKEGPWQGEFDIYVLVIVVFVFGVSSSKEN